MSYRYWRTSEDTFLRDNYAKIGPQGCAEHIDRSPKAIGLYATQKLGLRYEGPNKGAFRKGHATWNRGRTHNPDGSKAGRFKPGHKPATTRDDWEVYQLAEHGRTYEWIKHPTRGPMLHHHYLWEQANGERPKGYVLTFTDGNPLNCVLDNIECISRAENARRTTAKRPHAKNVEIGHKAWQTRDRRFRERVGLPVTSATSSHE